MYCLFSFRLLFFRNENQFEFCNGSFFQIDDNNVCFYCFVIQNMWWKLSRSENNYFSIIKMREQIKGMSIRLIDRTHKNDLRYIEFKNILEMVWDGETIANAIN